VPRLAAGGPGRRLVLATAGGPECTALTLAALAADAVVVPLPAETTPEEATRVFGLLAPDLLVVDPGDAAAGLRAARPAACPVRTPEDVLASPGAPWADAKADRPSLPEDAAIVQFTGGSSGAPKGIVLTRENVAAYLHHQGAFLARFTGQAVFCPVPQAHSYGGTVVLEHVLHGAGVHVATRFLPAADVQRMAAAGCRGLLAPPTYVRMLLRLGGLAEKALPELAWLNLGTAPTDPGLVEGIRAARPDLRVFVRYGLSETMGYVAREEIPPGAPLEAPGLVGQVIDGIEVGPLPAPGAAPAEIRVRGPVVAPARLGAGGVTALVDADGWYATGDLGCRDAAGRVHLRGRESAFLKRGGYRIDPVEIEALLCRMPEVAEALVVGVPDEMTGERVVAAVVAASAERPPDPMECLAVCRRELSGYKVPQECVRVDALPRTPAGKPDRPALVERLRKERR